MNVVAKGTTRFQHLWRFRAASDPMHPDWVRDVREFQHLWRFCAASDPSTPASS